MGSLVEIAELEAWGEHSLLDYSLKGDFDAAIAGFSEALDVLDDLIIDDSTFVPSIIVESGLRRGLGFTYLRKGLHPDTPSTQESIESAAGHLHAAHQATAATVGELLFVAGPEHARLLSAHGQTVSCMARYITATYFKGEGPLNLEIESQKPDGIRSLYATAHHFLSGTSAYGGARNAVGAALFERAVSGPARVQSMWLGRAAAFGMGASSQDTYDRKMARATVANHYRAMWDQMAAMSHVSSWDSV